MNHVACLVSSLEYCILTFMVNFSKLFTYLSNIMQGSVDLISNNCHGRPNAQQLADQAQRFSYFTGLVKPVPQNRSFLVVGRRGRGKVPLLRAVRRRMLLLGMDCTLACLPAPPIAIPRQVLRVYHYGI